MKPEPVLEGLGGEGGADLGITLLINGEAIPVTNLFDAAGDDVATWEDAFTFVAGPQADGSWLSAETADFQQARLN